MSNVGITGRGEYDARMAAKPNPQSVLFVAEDDAAFADDIWTVQGRRLLVDGTHTGSIETYRAAKKYTPGVGATDDAPILSGEIFILTPIQGSGDRIAVPYYKQDTNPLPFDVRINGANIEMYFSDVSATDPIPPDGTETYNGTGMVTFNGKGVFPASGAYKYGWNVVGTKAAGYYANVGVSIKPLSGAETGDTANPDDMLWGFSPSNAPTCDIAYVPAGSDIVYQYHRGVLNLGRRYGDATVRAILGASATAQQRSIEQVTADDGGHKSVGADQIYGFGTATASNNVKNCKFLCREVNSSIPEVRYPTYADVLAGIESDFLDDWQAYIDDKLDEEWDGRFSESFGNSFHNDLDGLQGGQEAGVDPEANPAEYYHLTEAQHTQAADLLDFSEETVYVITGFTGDPPVPTYEQRIILTKAVPE